MKRILYTIISAALVVGCSQDAELDSATTPVAVEFSTNGAITKTEEEELTATSENLRFSLVSTSTNTSAPTSSCIYYYNSEDNSLTRDEGSTGLYANNTTYYLLIATPTTEMGKVGSTSAYGHIIERSTDTPLYISDPITVAVDGIAISTGGSTYIHDLDEVTLKPRRSRLQVKFKCDLATDPRTVNDIYYKDVYNRAYTCPHSGILFSSDYPATNEVNEFTDNFPCKYSDNINYTTAATEDEGNYTYFISADYSAEGVNYPTLVIGLDDGDGGTREVDVPINFLMEPSTNYTYEINISSTILKVVVTSSSDWDSETNSSTINSIASFTVDINSGDWEDGGSFSSTLDLPTEDVVAQYVDFTTQDNSNCYILNPLSTGSSVYYIPISRIDEFWYNTTYVGDKYVRESNCLYTVGNNWEAVMHWHDFDNSTTYEPINNVTLEQATSPSGKACVKVTIPKEFAEKENHCNIGYVVRKTSDQTVLWSWHLWITDYNPYENQTISTDTYIYNVDGGELHRYDNTYFQSGGIYADKLIMDRNLGARSADFEGHGSMTSTTVTSPGTIYYQFGRKDPFPAYWNCVNGYAYGTSAGPLSFEDGVNSPNLFITNSGNWCDESDDDVEGDNTDYIWNDYQVSTTNYSTGKSIFDPSPQGFRVPISGTWTGFTSGSADNEYLNPDNYTFKLINNVDGVSTTPNNRLYNGFAFYPASGYRNYSSGGLSYIGSVGYYWSASPSSATNGYYLHFYSTGVTTANSNNRANGFPVRSIQE